MSANIKTSCYERDGPVGGPLAAMTMDELASWAACLNKATPGMNYARKTDYSEKEKARIAVLRLFTKDEWFKGLSILTMPGINWGFERMLLLMRERRKRALGDNGKRPERTYIASIERDEAIYRASMNWIPGGKESLCQLPETDGKPLSIRTYAIARYHRISFEDFVDASWTLPYDAAWLDFNGPITSQRMGKIARFWHDKVRWRMVLTWMNARYDAEAIKQIGEVSERSGMGQSLEDSQNVLLGPKGVNVFGWIEGLLGRKSSIRVLHRISYRDTSPMLQLAVEKV
jgi:hypothetical protein